jgi:hypothetical protein
VGATSWRGRLPVMHLVSIPDPNPGRVPRREVAAPVTCTAHQLFSTLHESDRKVGVLSTLVSGGMLAPALLAAAWPTRDSSPHRWSSTERELHSLADSRVSRRVVRCTPSNQNVRAERGSVKVNLRPSLRFALACVRVTRMTSESIHWAGKRHVRRHVTARR